MKTTSRIPAILACILALALAINEGSGAPVNECMFPTSGIDLDKKAINRVLASCSALIKSGRGDDEDRSIAFLQRGSMYRRLGKFELAYADFSASLKYDPNSAAAYTGRGNALRNMGKIDEAIADHTVAIRLKPNYPEAYSNRGNAWSDKKDYARAIADYDEAIRQSPKFASAFFNRALARSDSGDKEGAAADYREVLRLNPSHKAAAEALREIGLKP